MYVNILANIDGERHELRITRMSSVYSLKKLIEQRFEIMADNQALHYGHKILENDRTVGTYELDGKEVEVRVKMRGGKGLPLFMKVGAILVFIVFMVAMLFGFITLLSHIYYAGIVSGSRMIHMLLDKIGGDGNIVIKIIVFFARMVKLVLRYLMPFFMVYAVMVVCMYVFLYMNSNGQMPFCENYEKSKKFGRIIGMAYIISYAILNLGEILITIFANLVEVIPLLNRFAFAKNPMLESSYKIKGAIIGAIPFIGGAAKGMSNAIVKMIDQMNENREPIEDMLKDPEGNINKIEAKYGNKIRAMQLGILLEDAKFSTLSPERQLEEVRKRNMGIGDRLGARMGYCIMMNILYLTRAFYMAMYSCSDELQDTDKKIRKQEDPRLRKEMIRDRSKTLPFVDSRCVGNMVLSGGISGIVAFITTIVMLFKTLM